VPSQPSNQLETFDNPKPQRVYEIRFECPEFTCLCPMTGQPDFATVRIRYCPREKCVELKSLKLYLWSFRDQGAFHEGSRRGAESFESGSRTLGRTGLTFSPVGFGGYRVRVDAPPHRRALADAPTRDPTRYLRRAVDAALAWRYDCARWSSNSVLASWPCAWSSPSPGWRGRATASTSPGAWARRSGSA
jgi:hypothetical protein